MSRQMWSEQTLTISSHLNIKKKKKTTSKVMLNPPTSECIPHRASGPLSPRPLLATVCHSICLHNRAVWKLYLAKHVLHLCLLHFFLVWGTAYTDLGFISAPGHSRRAVHPLEAVRERTVGWAVLNCNDLAHL